MQCSKDSLKSDFRPEQFGGISALKYVGGCCWWLQKNHTLFAVLTRKISRQFRASVSQEEAQGRGGFVTGDPPGPFAIVFFSPTCCYAAAMLLLLLPVFLSLFALSFPASRSCLHSATCEVPILRPQLERTTCMKTAAWNSTHFCEGKEREHFFLFSPQVMFHTTRHCVQTPTS